VHGRLAQQVEVVAIGNAPSEADVREIDLPVELAQQALPVGWNIFMPTEYYEKACKAHFVFDRIISKREKKSIPTFIKRPAEETR
jgi:hypothetical protein